MGAVYYVLISGLRNSEYWKPWKPWLVMDIRIYESAMTWKPFAHDNPNRIGFAEKNTHDVWGACTSWTVRAEASKALRPSNLDYYYYSTDVRVTRGRHACWSTLWKANGRCEMLLCLCWRCTSVLESAGGGELHKPLMSLPEDSWRHDGIETVSSIFFGAI
jgi:muconolactone delta-isomerase